MGQDPRSGLKIQGHTAMEQVAELRIGDPGTTSPKLCKCFPLMRMLVGDSFQGLDRLFKRLWGQVTSCIQTQPVFTVLTQQGKWILHPRFLIRTRPARDDTNKTQVFLELQEPEIWSSSQSSAEIWAEADPGCRELLEARNGGKQLCTKPCRKILMDSGWTLVVRALSPVQNRNLAPNGTVHGILEHCVCCCAVQRSSQMKRGTAERQGPRQKMFP